jgi:hypothetical protein
MSTNLETAYKAKIALPFGRLQPVIDWCDRNCTNDWHYMEDPNDQWNSWVFMFESDRDYVAFTLWNK